jgi:DNA-binding transcriptional LysR family regulator
VNALWGDRLMAAYCADTPTMRLKVAVMPSREIISAIRSDLWELGFGPFQQQMPGLFATLPLYDEERVLVISRNHPRYPELRDDPEKLVSSVPLIVSHLDDPDLRPAIEKLRDSFGTIWEINDLALRTRLVMEGMGMAYVDRRYLRARDDLSDLVVLDLLPYCRFPLKFGLFYRKNKQLSMAAQRMIEICKGFPFV